METKINSQLIYDGAIIKVYQDQVVVEENNLTTIREVVRHHGGVGIIAIHESKIVLVKQFRYSINQYTIEIPAGKIEINEQPLLCASREIEEETGYRAKELTSILKIIPTPGYCDEEIHLFYTNDIIKVVNPRDADIDEFIDVVEMDIDEAYQLVREGKIIDAKTIIAIMYAKLESM